jgi:hypothetical protein
MKGFIIGIILGLCLTATASYFSFQSQKTTIGGKECIVVATASGVGVSCNWGR